MGRMMFAIGMLLVMAGFAWAEDPDNTFNKVNKHLHGIGSEAPQPSGRPSSTPPPESRAADPAPPVEEAAPVSTQWVGDDNHFIQADDYFIQKHELEGRAWMRVLLAKPVNPPSSATKGEGEFMVVKNGKNLWTSHFWKSRIAGKDDIRLGAYVICYGGNRHDGVYESPKNKEKARSGDWGYHKITDVSDTFKGYVTVTGNYKVGLSNLRVPLR